MSETDAQGRYFDNDELDGAEQYSHCAMCHCRVPDSEACHCSDCTAVTCESCYQDHKDEHSEALEPTDPSEPR